MITIEDITPEYIASLQKESEESRLASVVRDRVAELSSAWKLAKCNVENLEAECRIRAVTLQSYGVSEADIADMFDVRITTVRRWLK